MRIERVQKAINAAKTLVVDNFPGEKLDPEPGLIIATAILIALVDINDAVSSLEPR